MLWRFQESDRLNRRHLDQGVYFCSSLMLFFVCTLLSINFFSADQMSRQEEVCKPLQHFFRNEFPLFIPLLSFSLHVSYTLARARFLSLSRARACSLSLSFFLSVSVSFSIARSVAPSLPPSLSLSLSLFLSLSFFLSLARSLTRSLSLFLSLSLSRTQCLTCTRTRLYSSHPHAHV